MSHLRRALAFALVYVGMLPIRLACHVDRRGVVDAVHFVARWLEHHHRQEAHR